MKSINTEITINASAETVWNILMDFMQYPVWNPFIKELKGNAQVDQTLEVLVHPPQQKVSKFASKVLKVAPQKYFSWRGILLASWIMSGEHIFEIHSLANNQVKFVHYENFRGLLAGVILSKIGKSTEQGFMAMNEALKKKAEAMVNT